MKTFLLVAILITLALAGPFELKQEGNNIQFSMNVHGDSTYGLQLNGVLDPREDSNNKIGAFLKLADTYIPLLESLGTEKGSLKYERWWRFDFLGADVWVYWYFQLIVGWRVNPGSMSSDFFDVTYIPFVWGGTYAHTNGTTWPARGSAGVGLQYVLAYAPIGLQLYRQGRICFGGSWTVEPVHLRTDLFAALNECKAEIIDEIIDQVPIYLGCNYTNPLNITLYDVNFTDTYHGDLIPQTCFDF